MVDYFRPMLAARESPSSYPQFFQKLIYPMVVSPKYDGIRGIPRNGTVLSRTGKPLPSVQVQREFGSLLPFDGEFIEGNPTDEDVYHRTESHVMSANKPGDIHFYVFDFTDESMLLKPFFERLECAESLLPKEGKLHIVSHEYVDNEAQLLAYEQKRLQEGFEGIMMRSPFAPYKNNRSTFSQGWLLKLKRFEDAEGVLLDILEGHNNHNELKYDELGFAKRSDSKENKTPSGMAGHYIVDFNGLELIVAPGHFKHHERIEHLKNKAQYIGRLLKFRYFNRGVKDLPRFPRAVGFRDEMDV